jgi:glycosyltransferase involved in cell wall biosynthesis
MIPLISIILPVYNGQEFLKKTISSVLNQSFNNFEFLIIDDHSSDNSLNIINSFQDSRIKLIKNNSNQGQILTENKGLNIAKGKYIARIDQDDIFLPKKLEKQINFLEKNPKITGIGTWAIHINEKDKIIKKIKTPTSNKEIIKVLLYNNPIFHPSVMFRKKEILELGSYNHKKKYTEDYALWCQLLTSGYKLSNIPEYLTQYRIHNQQCSSNNKAIVKKNVLETRAIFLKKIFQEFKSNKKIILTDCSDKQLQEIAYYCAENFIIKKDWAKANFMIKNIKYKHFLFKIFFYFNKNILIKYLRTKNKIKKRLM